MNPGYVSSRDRDALVFVTECSCSRSTAITRVSKSANYTGYAEAVYCPKTILCRYTHHDKNTKLLIRDFQLLE